MTNSEALKHLKVGSKITHPLFTGKAWIKQASKTHYIDNLNNVVRIKTFWLMRTKPEWNKDWSIYKSN